MTVVLTIVGVLIALAGWWVGWQQMQMARVRLQYDLYDRRFKIYETAQHLLLNVIEDGEASDKVASEYASATSHAAFLLDDATDKFLSDLWGRVIDHSIITPFDQEEPRDDAEREQRAKTYQDRVRELREWLGPQFSALDDRFKPFLVLPEVRTVPLWMERLWRRLRG